ncbi:hypothetical protein [Synoicihabitans lomoniglobus]|uniref:Uncharacterized protein n=1 Tax=Synoicihabitans lomoniglobus TaxID=2909285 RepID=A0AAE9ZUP9_9BACT|nr:hypothetical protein [Opitutaceae bacterium LMO-M01]WED63374.1 hypothetical protein PXH66_13630 [Opitutaceae bacterium LMO-M01]
MISLCRRWSPRLISKGRWLIFVSVCLARLAGAPSVAPGPVIETVRPLAAGSWVGWAERDPTPLYLLLAGRPPLELGQVGGVPAAQVRSRDKVLWVGRDFAAVGVIDGSDPIENHELPGDWVHAAGNDVGFVISDGVRSKFSPDGRVWQDGGPTPDEFTRLEQLKAADGLFVALASMTSDVDGTIYRYSRLDVSSDGVAWETVLMSEPIMGHELPLEMLGHSGGRWFVAGATEAYVSTDGREWAAVANGSGRQPELRGAVLDTGGGEWWARNWKDQYEFSPDGLDWSAPSQYLHTTAGAGPFWVVGPEGMRNLTIDADGTVRVSTLAELMHAPAAQLARTAVRRPEVFQGTFAAVRFEAGYYVMPGDEGRIYFSTDLVDWEMVQTDTPVAVAVVRHDGERWVAGNKRMEAAYSDDRTTWTPYRYSHAARPEADAALWRGEYWAGYRILGVSNTYAHGQYGGEKDTSEKVWDEQVTLPVPTAIWRQPDRWHLVNQDGRYFTSDNGEYWQPEGYVETGEIDRVFFAAGNDGEVMFAEDRKGRVTLRVKTGEGFQEAVDSPVEVIHGLAYGAGRFFLAGRKTPAARPTFYRSDDGKNWTALFEWGETPVGLVFGPAGLVANNDRGVLMRYEPPPWPSAPGPARGPTPIPEINLRNFGENIVGKGKFRRNLGPQTADQHREKALYEVKARARNGDITAQLELAFVVLEGRYATFNPWRAERYFNAARAAGDATAARGYAELLTRWKPETPVTTIYDLYRESAARGDGASAAWLALKLPPDRVEPTEIARWRAQALEHDPGFAHKWDWREKYYAQIAAAEAGDADAMAVVGPILISGEVVAADRARGLELLWSAVAQDHENASTYLVRLYETEFPTKPTSECAVSADEYRQLLIKLSDTGNKAAIARLVNFQTSGQMGVPRDEAQAYARALALAETGDVDGMALLAGVLMEARGEVRDEAAAKAWLKKAAAAGHAGARQWLEQHGATSADGVTP